MHLLIIKIYRRPPRWTPISSGNKPGHFAGPQINDSTLHKNQAWRLWVLFTKFGQSRIVGQSSDNKLVIRLQLSDSRKKTLQRIRIQRSCTPIDEPLDMPFHGTNQLGGIEHRIFR